MNRLAMALMLLGVSLAHAETLPRPQFAERLPAPRFACESCKKCAVKGSKCDCGCLDGEPCRCLASKLRWQNIPNGSGEQVALMAGSKQVGAWSYSWNYFRELRADGTWGPVQENAPIEVPEKKVAVSMPALSSPRAVAPQSPFAQQGLYQQNWFQPASFSPSPASFTGFGGGCANGQCGR